MFVQNAKLLFPFNLVIANNIFEYLIERLGSLHKKIAFAESCTGGLLSSLLTKIAGSSIIFEGAMTTYSNKIKTQWLGVKEETLLEFGAVSKETVKEMLNGIMSKCNSDFALAVSGIAGPGRATDKKPVGTVVIGAKSKKNEKIETIHFEGDRNYIQIQAAYYAIKLLFDISPQELF